VEEGRHWEHDVQMMWKAEVVLVEGCWQKHKHWHCHWYDWYLCQSHPDLLVGTLYRLVVDGRYLAMLISWMERRDSSRMIGRVENQCQWVNNVEVDGRVQERQSW